VRQQQACLAGCFAVWPDTSALASQASACTAHTGCLPCSLPCSLSESGLAAVQLGSDFSVHKVGLDDVSEYTGPQDGWE
jgi:hypothetical protein